MKLEGAKNKLDEAKFFLNHLSEAQDERAALSEIPFSYYHSAFLNATYGVEQYIKSEVNRALQQQAHTPDKKQQSYNHHLKEWISRLSEMEKPLWDSMTQSRIADTHRKRVKTVTKQKAVPLGFSSRSPYGTVEYGNAFAARYMTYQQVAASYPEMAETVAKEFLPFGTGAWRFITEHHLEIGKVVQPIAIACKNYVDLLASLIAHFEPFVPDGGQS